MLGMPEMAVVLFILLSAAAVLWPAARICARIGYSPWLGLLAVLPFASVLLLWFVAFAEWPVERGGGRRG